MANSALAHAPTYDKLKEAVKIAKEVRKGSKDSLTFHNFNAGRSKPFAWHELVQATWANASKWNRINGT